MRSAKGAISLARCQQSEQCLNRSRLGPPVNDSGADDLKAKSLPERSRDLQLRAPFYKSIHTDGFAYRHVFDTANTNLLAGSAGFCRLFTTSCIEAGLCSRGFDMPSTSSQRNLSASVQRTIQRATQLPGCELSSVFAILEQRKGVLPESEAAQLMQLSASRFRHLFKERTGSTYREACVCIKLEQGANLLRSTDLAIPEISGLLHYSNRSKFEDAFKKHYHITPSQYRQQHRKN